MGELSIGDQQMKSPALSFESKVIIMDEIPTDALTDTETDSLFHVIRRIARRCIVHISPPYERDLEICDDVTVFRAGQCLSPSVKYHADRRFSYRKMRWWDVLKISTGIWITRRVIRLKVDNLCGPGVNDVSLCCERRDS
ncbi:hypothetical protein KCP76_09815 [Salmonella enterica subsp. enterica serovar Weltevreden]|nr:hypothetical protein KCP76_09815 [Salmonella enterica subsp. enterica serovar Weltevreden]